MDSEKIAQLCNEKLPVILDGFSKVLEEQGISGVVVVQFKLGNSPNKDGLRQEKRGFREERLHMHCHPCDTDPELTCCDPV